MNSLLVTSKAHLSMSDQEWVRQTKAEWWRNQSDWNRNIISLTKSMLKTPFVKVNENNNKDFENYLYTENMKANLSFAAMNLRKTWESSFHAKGSNPDQTICFLWTLEFHLFIKTYLFNAIFGGKIPYNCRPA